MAVEEERAGKSNRWEEQSGVSLEPDLERTRDIEIKKSESGEVDEMYSVDQSGSNIAKFQNKILMLKEQYRNQLTTECHQLKIHRKKDDDFENVIRDFDNRKAQPTLDKIKLIKDQWRTLDLCGMVQLVNPSHSIDIDREELLGRDERSEPQEDLTLRRSIVLCCIFEDLTRKLGWKIGDTLDIEEDICDVIGKLILNVEEQGRPSMLDCMQSAIMNIQANGSEPDGDKLRSLLITKKKYNGLNLACILLEQMIIDDKDTESVMRSVCAQFIDLVVQMFIEPEYKNDIRWNLNYLLKMGSLWSVADIYVLMRNGILLYRHRQVIFHRHLGRIRNFAVPPSLDACLGNDRATIFESILYCRDENALMWFDREMRDGQESEKSIDQNLSELKDDTVGQERKNSIKTMIENSRTTLERYKNNFKNGIAHVLERIRKSERKNGIDVLSSCLSVVSMAMHKCQILSALQRTDCCLQTTSLYATACWLPVKWKIMNVQRMKTVLCWRSWPWKTVLWSLQW